MLTRSGIPKTITMAKLYPNPVTPWTELLLNVDCSLLEISKTMATPNVVKGECEAYIEENYCGYF